LGIPKRRREMKTRQQQWEEYIENERRIVIGHLDKCIQRCVNEAIKLKV